MQKNIITNKITPCCGLPFSVVYWWISNLTLNSESDRQFILSNISQNGTISIDGWKVLVNSGTLEDDASLTKLEFLEWFDCGKQPTCEQLKLLIEAYKIGNWTPETELPLNLALIDKNINGFNELGNVYTKEQVLQLITSVGNADFGGKLIIADNPQPTEKKWFFLSQNGIYNNLGNIEAKANSINIAVFDGADWSAVNIPFEIEEPKRKKLFDFKRLRLTDVVPVNLTSATDENEGLRIKLNDAGAAFTTQIVANNFYTPNDTSSPFFCGLAERSYQKVIFQQKTLLNSGAYPDMGMGLSFASTNNFGYKWSALSYLCTNPNNALFGKIIIQANKGIGVYGNFQSENALTNYAVGDIIEFTFERLLHDYIVTVKNISKGNEISLRVTPQNNFSEYIPFNNANQCIHVASGDFLVFSWEYGWTLDRQADLYIAGDSITLGQSAVVEPLRWASKVGVKENNIISGGGADYLRSLRDRLQEIYILKPKAVLMMLGGNDILLGTPTQEWKDEFDFIVYHLQQNGIKVIICYPTARAGAGELINYINTSTWLQNVPKIDTNTPTAENGTTDDLRADMDGGDNLHPNNYGHQIIAETINNWFELNPL